MFGDVLGCFGRCLGVFVLVFGGRVGSAFEVFGEVFGGKNEENQRRQNGLKILCFNI